MRLSKSYLLLLSLLMTIVGVPSWSLADPGEFVYAEMEFPLSFVSYLHQYRFNPLAKFQTEVEGRLIELTCDPLVDIYQINSGQQAYRPCLASWRTLASSDKPMLNFNLVQAKWDDGKALSFADIWFCLQYKKWNKDSWGSNHNLLINATGSNSFDAFYQQATAVPKPGEFYFPVVNPRVFAQADNPAKAQVQKSRQQHIGYGRYRITAVSDNRYIIMQRRHDHPYYANLSLPTGLRHVERIRMQAFPKARMNRNEQFIRGRVHLLTNVTHADHGYIANSCPEAKTIRYSDDSFSGFVFNCRHPYLQPPPVRRAINYLFRKELALRKALGGEGEIVSGPLPRRNFFYNLAVPAYADNIATGIAVLRLYRDLGLDIVADDGKLVVAAPPLPGPAQELRAGDRILSIERKKVGSLLELVAAYRHRNERIFRAKIVRDDRVYVKRIDRQRPLQPGVWQAVTLNDDKLHGLPTLTLIANNPEGKNALIKSVCGAFKEDMAKVGINLAIDYLDSASYYPRLRQGKFDLAYRTLKLTGTPSIYRMFYYDAREVNTNYGRYANSQINAIAVKTNNVTDLARLKSAWKTAHKILHQDPPYLYLWSRRHILMHAPELVVHKPDNSYQVPYGYTEINGLINIFNEVHLWTWRSQ